MFWSHLSFHHSFLCWDQRWSLVRQVLLLIPSWDFSLVPPFRAQEKEQERTRPSDEQPKASKMSAQSPGPAPACGHSVPSPAMVPHGWAADRCARPQLVHQAWPRSHTSLVALNNTWALLATRNLPFFHQTALLSPDFKARRKVSFRLDISRSCLKSLRAWLLRWSDSTSELVYVPAKCSVLLVRSSGTVCNKYWREKASSFDCKKPME